MFIGLIGLALKIDERLVKIEIASESPSISTVGASETYIPQPSAASTMSQPQYGMSMYYFSG